MGAMAPKITSLTIVYSDADQRKHQNPASLTFVRGIHRCSTNSLHKWPITRKMLPFDDVIMTCSQETRHFSIGEKRTASDNQDRAHRSTLLLSMQSLISNGHQITRSTAIGAVHCTIIWCNRLELWWCAIEVSTLRPRQMAAIFQTTFSNAFCWMKMC